MREKQNSQAEIIAEIEISFCMSDAAAAPKIDKQRVFAWMKNPDLDVRGCLYDAITENRKAQLIDPPLTFDDYFDFVIPYIEQCIKEDPESEWSLPRYFAGYELVWWFKYLWNDMTAPRGKIDEIKNRLAILYKNGEGGLRIAIENSVLEHLFENRQIAAHFEDWRLDPALASAYDNALDWGAFHQSDENGNSKL